MKQLFLAAMAAASCIMAIDAQTLTYPAAPADPAVVDDYFGVKVPDLYRPLENDTAAATARWVEAENAVTRSYLDAIPYRAALHTRLTALYDYHKHGLPSKKHGWYFFYENDGLRNQSVLYRTRTLDGAEQPEVFLDPNALSDDGTVALTGIYFSHDGRYAAYTISRSGSDWSEIYVMDVATRELLPDHIEWAKFTNAEWRGDGFYYSAYPTPEKGKEYSNANENHRIYYHRIGTPQAADVLVYEEPQEPLKFQAAWVPDDESMLFVIGSGQGLGNSLMVRSLDKDNAEWKIMASTQDFDVNVVDVIDGVIYIYTNAGAPRYRLMTATLDSPGIDSWKELVAESTDVLSGINLTGKDKMILTYDSDARNLAYLYGLDGTRIREIALPSIGSVGFSSSRKHNEVFYGFTSFAYPQAIYRYDVDGDRSTVYRTSDIKGFQSADYVTEQVFYPSADGTRIPMFLTYKRGLRRDGSNPVYLYGYGGFNISLNPGFAPHRVLWLENGGIYAQANLRGGGEYGDDWHLAGTKLNKLNVFNDFIAAADYLVGQGWTSRELLAIEGASNGGLLVGATVNLRPDLCKVAIPRVGVMDMMRYHLFTIGWNWASDYGTSADSPEMASYLLGYSPLHTIRNDGTPYPAILVTTADHDDRVVPAHSFKYAAALQAANTGSAPKLIRIDSKAGHGGGKPVSKVIDEYADVYSFIFNNLGITPTAK